MTGLFKQKTPGNIILLILLGIFTKLPILFGNRGWIVKEGDGVLYTGLVDFLKSISSHPLLFVGIAFFLNLLIALVLNSFSNTERLMTKANFLPGMAYMLVTSLLPSFNLLSSNLIASLLLLFSFTLMYKSYNVKNNIFNSALLIGIASLFFLPAIFFMVWAFLAMMMLRPFRLTEWVVLLLGISAPYYFFAAYLFLTDQLQIPSYFNHLTFLASKVSYSIWHAGGLFFLLAPLLAGVYYMQSNSGKMLFHVRKGWYLMIWYLLIGSFIALFDIEKTSENILLVLVPIAAFHGYGYLNSDVKLYPKIAFWATIMFIVANQMYGNLW